MAGTGPGGGSYDGHWGAPPPPPPPQQWAPPAYPQWNAPAPKRTNPWVIVAVVAGALVLFTALVVAAVAVQHNKPKAPQERVAHAPPPPNYPSLFAGPASGGYAQIPDTIASGSGPLNESRIVSRAEPGHEPAVRLGLRNSGFVDGYERQWRLPSRSAGYSIVLYRFADGSGATHYAALTIAGSSRANAVSHEPGVNTSVRVGDLPDSAGKWWELTVTQKHDYVVIVRQWSTFAPPDHTLILGVTKRQLPYVP